MVDSSYCLTPTHTFTLQPKVQSETSLKSLNLHTLDFPGLSVISVLPFYCYRLISAMFSEKKNVFPSLLNLLSISCYSHKHLTVSGLPRPPGTL